MLVNGLPILREMQQWLQKFIYGKQLLKGAAKLFIKSQRGITSWWQLKEALEDEFGESMSAAEIHQVLSSKRKQKNESMLEFLYTLAEIGKNIQLDDRSLLKYFVDGIPDSRQNKTVLYQARNIRELKEAIKVYEEITKPVKYQTAHTIPQVESRKSNARTETKTEPQLPRRCFKCGNRTHLAKECTKQDFKCCKCNEFGHRSFECTKVGNQLPTTDRKKEMNMVNDTGREDVMIKEIEIGSQVISALIDTGCVHCLLRSDVLDSLEDSINLSQSKTQLVGFGGSVVNTMGTCEMEIRIDKLSFSVTFHVIAGKDLNYAAILGNSILDKVDIIASKGKVRLVEQNKTIQILERNDERSTRCEEKEKFVCTEWKNMCLLAEEKEFVHQNFPNVSHLNTVRHSIKQQRSVLLSTSEVSSFSLLLHAYA